MWLASITPPHLQQAWLALVCYGVLQWDAVCFNVTQGDAAYYGVLQCVAMYCSVMCSASITPPHLQQAWLALVCYGVLQWDAVCFNVTQCDSV